MDGITLDGTANAISGSSSMFRTDLFKGKRFLVTGGGTGLGRIMMEKFVELGADCVICGRRGGVLEETARQVMPSILAGRSRPTRSISGSPLRSRR